MIGLLLCVFKGKIHKFVFVIDCNAYSFHAKTLIMHKFLILPLIFVSLILCAQSGDLASRLEIHTSILSSDSLEGRGLGTEGKDRAIEYIVGQFEQVGLEPLFQGYRHEFQFRSGLAWIPATNLVGIIPGTDPVLSQEYIVIGAHYDHLGYSLQNKEKVIFSGADDNASGVASIIELARSLTAAHDPIKRSVIIVAFDAEESGLLGATRFVEDSVVSPDQIKLMLSLDMVGMYSTHAGLDLKGIESLVNGGEIAEKIASEQNITLKKKGKSIEARTDTKPFGDVGIPAVHVYTGSKSPYHEPEDKYDLLDYTGMAMINTYLHELIKEIANTTDLQPVPEVLSDPEASSKKFKVFEFGMVMGHGTGHHRYPDLKTKTFSAYNFSVGIMAQVRVLSMVTIQPEVLFDLNNANRSDGKFRRQSITIPLNLQVGTPIFANSGFRLYGLVGPYHRFHLGVKDGQGMQVVGEDYQSTEWGYNLGFGLDIANIHLTWTFRRGLTNIVNTDTVILYDRNSLFTLGYKF